MALKAIVTQTDGGVWSGTSVPWTAAFADGGVLTKSGGNWTGMTNAPSAAGTYQMVAGWDGGPTQGTSFSVDTTGPLFVVQVQAPPSYGTNTTTWFPNDPELDAGTAYRRDEIATVVVGSLATDVDPASVTLEVRHGSDPIITFTDGGPVNCAQPFCWGFQVDLSKVQMSALRGLYVFRANGADMVGNTGDAGQDQVGVTRWQWAEQVSQATAGAVKASPAIGTDGTVYIARAGGSALGVLAIATDGGPKWEQPGMGPIIASPAIAEKASNGEEIFAEAADGLGTIRAVNRGGQVDGSQCTGVAGTDSAASLAIVGDNTTSAMALGIQPNGLTSILGGFAPFLVPHCPSSALAVPTASYPANIVVTGDADGGVLFYPDDNGKIQPASLSGNTFTPGLETPTMAIGAGVVNGLSLYLAGGLRITGGGSGGPGIGKLFQLDGGVTTGTEWEVAGTPVSAPVVTSAGRLLAVFRNSNGTADVKLYDSAGAQQGATVNWPVTYPASGNPGVPSPVLGADGAAYLISNSGDLLVLDVPSGMILYFASPSPVFSTGKALASPTIDCNWTHPSSSTGVLYFVTDTGLLVSYLVDAKGLDTNSPWPKYQHDARNTGNMTTVITPCP